MKMKSKSDQEKIKAIEDAIAKFSELGKDKEAMRQFHSALVDEKTKHWKPNGVRSMP